LVPEFELLALANEDHGFVELRVFTKRRRDEHATRTVHIDVHGKADQTALQFPDARIEVRQTLELLLDQFPVRKRIDEQAAVGICGDDQVTPAALEQCVTMPSRNRETALN